VYYSPFDVHFYKKDIKEPDVCQPDLLVACDLEENVINGRYMGTPTLVIEILSPSTRRRDLLDKLNTYTRSGVKEYWIVDPKDRRVMVYCIEDHDILDFTIYQLEEGFESLAFPGLKVTVADIFAG
jgi:Uma2 family endonuclease